MTHSLSLEIFPVLNPNNSNDQLIIHQASLPQTLCVHHIDTKCANGISTNQLEYGLRRLTNTYRDWLSMRRAPAHSIGRRSWHILLIAYFHQKQCWPCQLGSPIHNLWVGSHSPSCAMFMLVYSNL